MSAQKRKPVQTKPNQRAKGRQKQQRIILFFLAGTLILTGIIYLPLIKNELTNWDDAMYIVQNPLLKDLSWAGIKKIFSTPVVSNYHPLTVLSLAFNYQVSGVTASGYLFTNVVLHVLNTGLVFWFIMLLSDKNIMVSIIAALLFGVHPMHVESVAWASERKDVLYTIFYLLAMISYIFYFRQKKVKWLIWTTVLAGVSLLCKPAAIVLPFSLLLLDYYFKRKWDWQWVYEKLPVFMLSVLFGVITVMIQSEKAIASIDEHTLSERICFAGYGLTWYVMKCIVPFGLSAFHPFPRELPFHFYLLSALSFAGIGFLLWKRNRLYIFSFGFYIINLLLVLQVMAIGNAVVAERYTYVPYIGLFFLLAMEAYRVSEKYRPYKMAIVIALSLWIAGLIMITWKRIPVWRNSETLWKNVLQQYPESPRAWTNKALYHYELEQWDQSLSDLTQALGAEPNFADALEWRARIFLKRNEIQKAYEDASRLHQLFPEKPAAMFLLARSYEALKQPKEALDLYNKLILLEPNISEYIHNRGVVYFNQLKQYDLAKKDFENAIAIDPGKGIYHMNLSRCYYVMNDFERARASALQAEKLGEKIDPGYAEVIGL